MADTEQQIQELVEMTKLVAAQNNHVAENPPVVSTKDFIAKIHFLSAASFLFSLAGLVVANVLLISTKHVDLSSEETHHPSREPLSWQPNS